MTQRKIVMEIKRRKQTTSNSETPLEWVLKKNTFIRVVEMIN